MPPSSSKSRVPLLVIAGTIIGIVGYLQVRMLLDDSRILKPYDFVEYWCAGRLFLDGQNPYEPDLLQPMQRALDDRIIKAVMMWNPPWALPLTLPFAALPWRLGQLLWLAVQLAAVLLSVDWLWRLYGGSPRYRWVSWLLGLMFAPTYFLLFVGQISGLLLLGIAGFLHFWRKDRPILAGGMAVLTALKPHHLALFALVLLLEALHDRRTRRVILTGAAILVVCSLLPLLWITEVWQQYREALHRPTSATFESMEDFEHDTIGYWLRQRVPGQPFVAMFMPLGVAVIAVVICWYRQRHSWNWQENLPWLIIVSMLVTPYGAWAFDMVLLLVPLIYLAVLIEQRRISWKPGLTIAVWMALNWLTVAAMPRFNAWIAPAVGTVFIVALLFRTRQQTIDVPG